MYHTQVALPDELGKRLEDLAAQIGEEPEALLREAVQVYLDQVAEDDARLAASIAQADRGETFAIEEVHAEDAALLARLRVTPEQVAAIDDEIRAEFEAAYGISL